MNIVLWNKMGKFKGEYRYKIDKPLLCFLWSRIYAGNYHMYMAWRVRSFKFLAHKVCLRIGKFSGIQPTLIFKSPHNQSIAYTFHALHIILKYIFSFYSFVLIFTWITPNYHLHFYFLNLNHTHLLYILF